MRQLKEKFQCKPHHQSWTRLTLLTSLRMRARAICVATVLLPLFYGLFFFGIRLPSSYDLILDGEHQHTLADSVFLTTNQPIKDKMMHGSSRRYLIDPMDLEKNQHYEFRVSYPATVSKFCLFFRFGFYVKFDTHLKIFRSLPCSHQLISIST